MKSSQVPHELVMKLLAVLGFSSECLAGEEAASKLTHAADVRPESLSTWAFLQDCLTTWQLASPRVGDPRKSGIEAAMSFVTCPWKPHTIISITSYWLPQPFNVVRGIPGQEYQEVTIMNALL